MARAFSSIPLLLLPRASSRAFCATPSLLSTAVSSEEAPLLARRVGKADSLGSAAADGGHSRRHKRTKAWSRDRGVMAGIGAEIVSAGAPVLREPAEEVTESMLGSPELQDLVDRMIDTMRAAPGVGLAAPQIGVPLQVIVLEDRPEYIAAMAEGVPEMVQRVPFEPLAIVNPRLRALSQHGMRFYEGCLSVPHYQALVERYTSVEVEGLTVDGRPLKLQANGWQARILQHEVDHLRGTLYVDRMLSRSFSIRGNSGRLPEDVPRPGPCTCCHAIDCTAEA
ncbi:hypothetical protein ABPG77_002800 [Micractinium sp. CCAP 211/92]